MALGAIRHDVAWHVTRGSAAIDLTTTEVQLVAALARQPGRIFTRAQLLDALGIGGAVVRWPRFLSARLVAVLVPR